MLDVTLKNAAILIVDDQEANVRVLERLLERDGYTKLRSITDSRQTVALLAEFQPDLILLDLLMPYLDGFAVLEQLRQVIPTDNYLPILVLTADITPEARLRALASGAKDFLTKPIDVVETLLRLKNLLEARFLHLQLQRQNEILEARVRARTADLARANADLTQANVELWQSEVKNQAILNAIPDIMFRIHRDGTFLDYHATHTDELYTPPESFLGKTVSQVLPAPTADLFTQAAERALQLGKIQTVEYQLEVEHHRYDYEARIIANGEQEVLVMARNITERKQAEADLAWERYLMQALMINTPDAIYFKDRQSRFTRANPAAAHKHGLSDPEQLVGKGDFDFFATAQAQAYYEAEQRLLQTGQPVIDLEEEEIWADGTRTWSATTTLPLRNELGQMIGLIGIARDVTKRKQAEAQLRESQAQTAGVIGSAMDAIVTVDAQQRIILFNTAAEKMFNVSSAEANGQTLDRFIPARFREIHGEHIRRFGDTHLTMRQMGALNDLAALRADGTEFPIEASISQIEIAEKKLFTVILRDITERKQAEAALRESEERFRLLFEHSPDAIMLIDPHSTSEPWVIVDCNEVASQRNGYPRDELIGHSIDRLNTSGTTAEEHAEYLERLHRAGTFTYETQHRRRDGTIFPIEVSTAIVTLAGRELVLGIDRDITERKQAEERSRWERARTNALLRTANRLNAQLDLDAILKTVCEETAQALMVSATAVALYDEQRQVFEVVADFGLPREYRERTSPTPRALYDAYTQQMGPIIVVPDMQAIPGLPDPDLYVALNMRTVVSASLMRDQQMVGTLSLITLGEVRHFTDETLDLLKGLADQAAQAITNARLFAETETRLEHLRALREIDRAIVGSLDMRLTLKVFLDQTIQQLHVDAAAVLLMSATNQTLMYGAGQGFRTRDMERASVRVGESFAGQVALEHRRVAIPDIRGLTDLPAFTRFVANEAFIAYYGIPLIAKGQLIGVLEVYQRTPLHPNEEWLNFMETLAGQAAIAIDNARLFNDLQRSNLQLTLAYDDTIEGWSRALDLRDKETEGHSQRVTDLTLRLARAMDFDEAELVHVRRGALLHDIGKMGVPDGVLLKPGKLTDEEWVIMKKHPAYAYDLLSPIAFLRPALDIPYCHHEKWDGTGYPRQLKGEAIPLSARLFAVVDVWDALRSDRPYRAGWPEDKVLAHIQSLAGTHFEARVVDAFLQLLQDDGMHH